MDNLSEDLKDIRGQVLESNQVPEEQKELINTCMKEYLSNVLEFLNEINK